MVTRTSHITEIDMMCRMRAQGQDVHALIESACTHADLLSQAGVPYHNLDLSSRLDIKGILFLRKLIRKEKFQVVHGFSNRPISNLVWASLNLPHVLVAYRGAIGHVRRWDPDCWLKWLHPRLDRISCVSEAVRQDLKNSGVRPDKLVTIYKGHNFSWYDDLARINIHKEFKIPAQAVIVGCAANMRRIKGVDVLIESLYHLPEHIHLLLMGEVRDPLLIRLSKDPRLTRRIHFAGFRKDAPSLLGSCCIAVAPSRGREGLTKSIIEPMAQGVPVVVTAAGGLPEMVEHGKSGFVVPMEDPAAMAQAIKQLTCNPEKRKFMGQNARKYVRSRFSINQTVNQTLEMYHQACTQKGILS
ncbi:glycosyltransferase [Desulfonatronovibrio magnus]|uniref:glycosyltransferase n=1 Tax=Desulfonatronovibrio magnus TaxID=698827 RepID=UPI0012F9FE25|nr:glycosyltransferase [Desulfonatronovibrio magnus]